MSEKDFDLICIGRSCVELYSGEFGVPLERAMTFTKSVGGSPMNIAIGTSRLGLRVGAITGVGQEDNGRYLKWQLSCEGVDVSAVKTDPKRLTAMVLLSIRGDNDFPLIQYRENCADMGLTAEDIAHLRRQEKFDSAYTLNASIGKNWYIHRQYTLGFSLEVKNILNNQDIRTGGYEQTRLTKNTETTVTTYQAFDSKYFYMFGTTYYLNLYFRF